MIARGYVVVTVNYRNEIPYAYEQSKPPQNLPDSISGDRRMLKSGPTLDHEDLIAIIRYLQTLPYIDKNAVGAMGVSHSGEMIMKASSEYTFALECASNRRIMNVDRRHRARCARKDNEIEYNDIEVARKNANKVEAMQRIQRINTPILIFTHRSPAGNFQARRIMDEGSGQKRAMGQLQPSGDGYVFIFNQPDGSYKPDEIQQKTFEIFMDYFDKHLKH